MNTVLYAIIVCLLLIVAYLGYRHVDVMKHEKGLDEIEEGYQADIMDLEDRIESLTATVHQVSNRGLHERTDLRNQLADETQAKDDAFTELAQAMETIENLNEECNEKQTLMDALTQEVQSCQADKARLADALASAKDELDDVRQTALDMQIELTVPEAKTPETIFRETREALGEYDRISPDAKITLDPDAEVKDPSGTVIGTVDGVRNTPEGLVVDMTFNDNVPWAGKSAHGLIPSED